MSAARKIRRPLAVQRSDGTTSTVTGNRCIQTLEELKRNGSRGISSLTHPGLRLSHYVSVLRHKYGFAINMEKVDQPGGVGWYGRYTLSENVELIGNVSIAKKQKPSGKRALNQNTVEIRKGSFDAPSLS